MFTRFLFRCKAYAGIALAVLFLVGAEYRTFSVEMKRLISSGVNSTMSSDKSAPKLCVNESW